MYFMIYSGAQPSRKLPTWVMFGLARIWDAGYYWWYIAAMGACLRITMRQLFGRAAHGNLKDNISRCPAVFLGREGVDYLAAAGGPEPGFGD